jgi:hypothetical protein
VGKNVRHLTPPGKLGNTCNLPPRLEKVSLQMEVLGFAESPNDWYRPKADIEYLKSTGLSGQNQLVIRDTTHPEYLPTDKNG